MGTTTKMAIPYPEATGLVKDGWEDMKDIATQVDAKSGLILINTTSFSAVSSQSINNVFTSSYENYRFVVNFTGASANQFIYFRLRAAGSDITGSNYSAQLIGCAEGANTAIYRQSANAAFLYPALLNSSVPQRTSLIMDILKPELTENTLFLIQNNSVDNSTAMFSLNGSGIYKATTSADGITIYPDSGNFTGRLSIYGYNK